MEIVYYQIGTILPDLVDDVAKEILSYIDTINLYQLKYVSKSWLNYYNNLKAIEIVSSLPLYFNNCDFTSNYYYNIYKPIMDNVLNDKKEDNIENKQDGIEINVNQYNIISENIMNLKNNNDYYIWIRTMISHYIKTNDIINLHNITEIHDSAICYSSIWEHSLIFIQALETNNMDMIKYCFYQVMLFYMPESPIIKFNIPDYIYLGNIEQYYDFSSPDNPINGYNASIYLDGNTYLPPRYKGELIEDTKFINENLGLYDNDIDIDSVWEAINDYKYDLCEKQINKILNKVGYIQKSWI